MYANYVVVMISKHWNISYFEADRDYHLNELKKRFISSGGRAVFDLYVDLPPREKLILLIDIFHF